MGTLSLQEGLYTTTAVIVAVFDCLADGEGAGVGRVTRSPESVPDDDDVGLNVLGCRADILGTNCSVHTPQQLFTQRWGRGRVAWIARRGN